MFFRLFRYNILKMIREKEIMFWTLAFPLILGTLFYLSFGNFMEKAEVFNEIPIAYVEESSNDIYFKEVIDTLKEGEDALLTVVTADKKEAENLLKEGKITGILTNGEKISLIIQDNGIGQSILNGIVDEYMKKQSAISTIAQKNPEALNNVLSALESEVTMIKEEALTKGSMDPMMRYFHALIAMSCLYGSFMGVQCACKFKANLSALGARRVVASTNRLVIVLADVLSSIVIQIVCTMIAVCYLRYILNVDMGSNIPYIFFVVVFGSIIGVMTGFLIGSLGKLKEDIKTGLNVAITMTECFLSGLMITEMYTIIENNFPIFNRINPAAVITNSLYSLNIYNSFERFWQNMLLLFVMSVILWICSYFVIRRERYADI